MSLRYRAISWNPQKRRYDAVMAASSGLYLALFVGVSAFTNPNATIETLLIRAFGTAALLLLHVILLIGPLCRLQPRFLPLLYNRRHLGVTTFVMGLAHGGFALFQFHALGDTNPLVSLLISNRRFDSLANFPFQPLGFIALVILFLMAATSHDFWLKQLSPVMWKRLHMLVYAAYALLIAHVALGVLQAETNPLLAGVLAAGMIVVLTVHLLAAQREHAMDKQPFETGFVAVCALGEIPEKRARVISLNGERIAVFKHDGKLSALSNVCQHQNGPLGEGRIVDGCVTCPWHGYQYLPETGVSPPPFKERVATYRVKLIDGVVYVNPEPVGQDGILSYTPSV
ncbi:MAG: Rieske 2Fe-2S domain-containing protein [Acidobacteria bacterium]|nr:Rieske 2Fe-2S domain-containing protein [Acidobacteriota bacterium]